MNATTTATDPRFAALPGGPQLLILCLIWAVTSAFYLILQWDLFFYVDEGDWVTFAGTRPVTDFLEPFNEHLILIPLLAFRLVLELAGSSYPAFTILELIALISLSLGLFTYARERIDPWVALAPAVLPFFIAGGLGFTSLLMPLVGVIWFLALSLGLWALILVEKGRTSTDLAASLQLVYADGVRAAIGAVELSGKQADPTLQFYRRTLHHYAAGMFFPAITSAPSADPASRKPR